MSISENGIMWKARSQVAYWKRQQENIDILVLCLRTCTTLTQWTSTLIVQVWLTHGNSHLSGMDTTSQFNMFDQSWLTVRLHFFNQFSPSKKKNCLFHNRPVTTDNIAMQCSNNSVWPEQLQTCHLRMLALRLQSRHCWRTKVTPETITWWPFDFGQHKWLP